MHIMEYIYIYIYIYAFCAKNVTNLAKNLTKISAFSKKLSKNFFILQKALQKFFYSVMNFTKISFFYRKFYINFFISQKNLHKFLCLAKFFSFYKKIYRNFFIQRKIPCKFLSFSKKFQIQHICLQLQSKEQNEKFKY